MSDITKILDTLLSSSRRRAATNRGHTWQYAERSARSLPSTCHYVMRGPQSIYTPASHASTSSSKVISASTCANLSHQQHQQPSLTMPGAGPSKKGNNKSKYRAHAKRATGPPKGGDGQGAFAAGPFAKYRTQPLVSDSRAGAALTVSPT